jgi:hypothetical protein
LDKSDDKEKESDTTPIEDKIEDQPDKQISTTDPDSRLVITTKLVRIVCFNL